MAEAAAAQPGTVWVNTAVPPSQLLEPPLFSPHPHPPLSKLQDDSHPPLSLQQGLPQVPILLVTSLALNTIGILKSSIQMTANALGN